MLPRDRHKLHFGPYRTPRFKLGQRVQCARRGEVTIVGMTDGRIQWPLGRRGRGKASLVLYAGLADAVRKESGPAVMHWWGFRSNTLWAFRKALGVKPSDIEGLHRLRVAHGAQPWFKAAQRKAWSKARDPQRREKIAAAKRGKPRPAEVIEALRRANIGRKISEATRAKMSEAQRRRGTRPPKAGRPWTAAEDKALRTLPTAEVVKLTGRSLSAVRSRRHVLKLPDGRRVMGR